MGNGKAIGSGAVSTHKQPARKTLLDFMFGIAAGELHRLRELRLDVSQYEKLETATEPEFLACGLQRRAEPMARQLHVNAIQAVLAPHQGGHSNHRFGAEYADFDFGAILKGGGRRAHALFNEHEFIDLASNGSNLLAQFKRDRPERETGDDTGVQAVEELVGVKACRQSARFVPRREESHLWTKYEPARSVAQPNALNLQDNRVSLEPHSEESSS